MPIRLTVRPPSTTPELPSRIEQTRWFADEVQPHEPALRAYLSHKYPTLPDVDDFVQESFLKAVLARERGKLVSVKGFLFHVARNAAVSFFRKRKFISTTPVNELDGLRVLQCDADIVEHACAQDELESVVEVMAALPERCRQVVMLRLMQGMDYAEIAVQLGISEATVRVQIARGMTKCTEFLRARGVLEQGRA